jgi:RHS repeat-associated protein
MQQKSVLTTFKRSMGCPILKYHTNSLGDSFETTVFPHLSVHRKRDSELKNYVKLYTYGFNGMEKDDEIKGTGNSYDFGARMYDSRLGRWLSIDKMHSKYPEESPYSFVKNMPIIAVDPDGERVYVVIERAEMKDGKEIMVKKVYDVVLDRELLELAAPDFVAYYDLALETELGKQDVQPFEDSETEDIYFAMVDFVSTEDDGLTLGRASNNVNVVDGKISPIKTLDDEEKLYYEYEEVFEGVLVNPEKQIHIISMNTQWFDEIIFEILGPEDGAGVILHEVIFHISWSNDGVSTLDQHDKAYGTTRDIHKDLCSKATEESPQRLLEEQVKDAIKIREGKKKSSENDTDNGDQ